MTHPSKKSVASHSPGLAREMGLIALTSTGIASMVGAGINVVPFMIQRNVPGIGAWVLPAFLFAGIPAFFAGLSYAILASAMPRAGGSYVYASRALNPYLGFIASFAWVTVQLAIVFAGTAGRGRCLGVARDIGGCGLVRAFVFVFGLEHDVALEGLAHMRL